MRSLAHWVLRLVAIFLCLLGLHLRLLGLPYYWDEAGYYVPAAWDFYHHWLLIPESTLHTGHTPLVMVYLALAWHAFGFSPLVTRVAMVLIASGTVVATYALARRVADREPAIWAAALLAFSPMFFAQSTVVYLDLPAALFTTLAVLALLDGRMWLFALTASLGVLTKETTVVMLPVAWVYMYLGVGAHHGVPLQETQNRWRARHGVPLQFWIATVVPILPLAAWTLYYRHKTGFWTGNPHADTYKMYIEALGCGDAEGLFTYLNDDCRWIGPQSYQAEVYRHPSGQPMFDAGLDREKFGSVGPLAHCEAVEQIADYPWPDPAYLDFAPCLRDLRAAGDHYRLSGFWTPFFHNVCDLFGMEEYLVKMHTMPEVVHAVTDRVCAFYHAANERFFAAAGDMVDGFFFGNDFGTQQSLICGPGQFNEFILPWLRKFTKQGHDHGLQVILHSCGAIHPVIEQLIAAGVNCLHPLQALAKDMDAATLARDFKGRVAFMGGIDMQELLTNGTPDQVRAEVHRVKSILGPNLIVSPSHEAILPNVPPQNIAALARAALE